MLKRIFCLIFSLLIILSLVSCNVKKQKFSKNYIEYFDTVCTVVGYEFNENEFNKTCDYIENSLEEYNNLFDIYKSYDGINNIKTINSNAGKQPVVVDKRIIDLLLFSKEMFNKTNGTVNVAMGSVLKIWHNHREMGMVEPENATVPEKNELLEANNHTNIDNIVIDEENSTVYLNDSEMSLDVGAIAKGYATERIAQELINQGKTAYTLNFGGNIRTIGNKGDDTPWTAAVTNPDLTAENTTLMRVKLTDCVFVTSGSYQRFYEVDGTRYHHIINPETLYPENNFASVSIYAKDSGLADALSTSLFNLSLEDGKRLISTFDGVQAMWVSSSGEITYTDGFKDIIIEDK